MTSCVSAYLKVEAVKLNDLDPGLDEVGDVFSRVVTGVR
jgi:hypothetical protein